MLISRILGPTALFLIFMGCSSASVVTAGSLVPDPLLKNIGEVDLVISTGDLGYEPNLDREKLQNQISDRFADIL